MIPTINAVANPAAYTLLEISDDASSLEKPELITSFATFPRINGTTIKKEKRAACSRSIPKITDVPIVDPEREIPGRIATIWAIPIMIASLNPTDLSVLFALSATNRITPVTMSISPTNKIFPLKKLSIKSSKKTPTTAAGIMEMIIFAENKNSSLILN